MKNKVSAIVLAAGQGKRMNLPTAKQFLILQDKPVLYYSIKAFEDSHVDEIILVCSQGQIEYCSEHIIKPYGLKKVKQIVEGGKERYDSVYRGLEAIGHTDYVLIHDGARPFIAASLINDVIKEVRESKACIVAVPVKDTIKVVDEDGWISQTPNRNLLWSAQTPQAFEYTSIIKAYEKLFQLDMTERKCITDDAMVYEKAYNLPIKIVKGDYSNIKLTTPDDIVHAQQIAVKMHI